MSRARSLLPSPSVLAFLVPLILLFGGCSKDEETNPGGPGPANGTDLGDWEVVVVSTPLVLPPRRATEERYVPDLSLATVSITQDGNTATVLVTPADGSAPFDLTGTLLGSIGYVGRRDTIGGDIVTDSVAFVLNDTTGTLLGTGITTEDSSGTTSEHVLVLQGIKTGAAAEDLSGTWALEETVVGTDLDTSWTRTFTITQTGSSLQLVHDFGDTLSGTVTGPFGLIDRTLNLRATQEERYALMKSGDSLSVYRHYRNTLTSRTEFGTLSGTKVP